MLNTKTANTCTFEDLLKPSAQTAYTLGHIDGQMGALDLHPQFTPYEADYQRGYLDGALGAASKRIPLTTPVRVSRLGIDGVITAHSTCDRNRYQVSWYDPRWDRVYHKWLERGVIEVMGNKTAA